MDNYQVTFETWNKLAYLYQEKFMNLDLFNDSYDHFCELVQKENAHVLEIGCGPGNITKYIISKRPDFKIVATDVAPEMIRLAKLNNPSAECRIMDCRTIDTLSQKFDAIMCGFCIPYLSAEYSGKLIADSNLLLHEKGILYFSTIKGNYDDSGFRKSSAGDGCYQYYYEEEYFKNELIKNGFKLLSLVQKEYLPGDGRSEINQVFVAEKMQ
jgi:2-polyprenyl-3-methyl-5-hydroxy-6-metoxy-1,4-benzoquinol methylase